jgi:hypothetical protein
VLREGSRPTAPLRCVAVASVAIAASAGISACSADAGAGPVQSFMEKGRPIVDEAGAPVLPGQASDGTAFIVNTGDQPVTLLSAASVPVPGYPAGVLSHIGIASTLNIAGSGIGWPPDVPIRAFTGATIPHGETRVIFGIVGAEPGKNYASAGVRISYRYGGQEYTVVAWSGVVACVMTQHEPVRKASDDCNLVGNKILAPLDKESGLS